MTPPTEDSSRGVQRLMLQSVADSDRQSVYSRGSGAVVLELSGRNDSDTEVYIVFFIVFCCSWTSIILVFVNNV